MLSRFLKKYRLQALGMGGVAVLLASQPAAADGCLLHPAKLTNAAVEGFRQQPQGLLGDYPAGGVVMSAAVRRLAGTDVATVSELVSLAKGASVPQIVAIGTGLAGAVNVCKPKRPDLAQRISDEVKRAQIPALFAAFAASVSLRQTAVMGAPEGPPAVGRAPTVQPQAKAPQEDLGGDTDAATKRPGEEPSPQRASFGNGGIVRTVVKPVSPAR